MAESLQLLVLEKIIRLYTWMELKRKGRFIQPVYTQQPVHIGEGFGLMNFLIRKQEVLFLHRNTNS